MFQLNPDLLSEVPPAIRIFASEIIWTNSWVLLSMFKGFAHTEGPEMFVHSSGSRSQSQDDSTILKLVKGMKFDRPIPVVVSSLIYLWDTNFIAVRTEDHAVCKILSSWYHWEVRKNCYPPVLEKKLRHMCLHCSSQNMSHKWAPLPEEAISQGPYSLPVRSTLTLYSHSDSSVKELIHVKINHFSDKLVLIWWFSCLFFSILLNNLLCKQKGRDRRVRDRRWKEQIWGSTGCFVHQRSFVSA